METKRLAESVEGLNSSIAIAAGKLWPKLCRPYCLTEVLLYFTIALQ